MPSPSLSRRCSSSPFALSCLLFSTGLALLLAGACWVVSRTTRANGKASPPRMSPRSGREKEKEKDRSLSFARRRERERRRLSTWSALSLFSFSLSLSRSSLGSCCPATFAAAVFPREKQRETETGTEYLGRRFLPFSLSHSRHPLLFLSTLSFSLLSLPLLSSRASARARGHGEWTVPDGVNVVRVKMMDSQNNVVLSRDVDVQSGYKFVVDIVS